MDGNCWGCSKQILESPFPNRTLKLFLGSQWLCKSAELRPSSLNILRHSPEEMLTVIWPGSSWSHCLCLAVSNKSIFLQISYSQLFIIWLAASHLCPLIHLSKFLQFQPPGGGSSCHHLLFESVCQGNICSFPEASTLFSHCTLSARMSQLWLPN